MSRSTPKESKPISFISNWLGEYPGRTLHRIGITIIGIWITGNLLNTISPQENQVSLKSSRVEDIKGQISLPKRPITILISLISEKKVNNNLKQGFLRRQEEIQSFMLVRISKNNPVEILQIPIELAIKLPGEEKILALSETFNKGGVALSADVIMEIIGRRDELPERYMIFPIDLLEEIINQIGEIKVRLDEPLYEKIDKNRITLNLSAGLQRLSGKQSLEFILYKSKKEDDIDIRERRELVIKGIAKQMAYPENSSSLNSLSEKILARTRTNITRKELLSLFAVAMNTESPPIVKQLPLDPKLKNQDLRQLKKGYEKHIWLN